MYDSEIYLNVINLLIKNVYERTWQSRVSSNSEVF